MPDAADLELSLRAVGGGEYAAELRFLPPGGAAESHLVGPPHPRVRLDPEALLTVGVAADPAAYGARLTQLLFADLRLREGLARARALAAGAGVPLRLRLRLPAGDAAVHALAWETLRDPAAPEQGGFWFVSEQVHLSRYLEAPDLTPIARRPRPGLRALVTVADPVDGAAHGLAPMDATEEVLRAWAALEDGMAVPVLARANDGTPATLANLAAALRGPDGDGRGGPDVLYLVCHGGRERRPGPGAGPGRPFLVLEREDGRRDPVPAAELVGMLAAFERRPVLVVLAACQSAGRTHDAGALAAVGPGLAAAGVGAVVAMQTDVTMATVERLMLVFFRELRGDGQVDRALAAARATVARDRPDWWAPVLYLRLRDGRLWTAGPAPAPAASVEPPPGRLARARRAPPPDARSLGSEPGRAGGRGAPPRYLDFEVEIGRGRGRVYPIAVRSAAAGEARETMRFPYTPAAVEARLGALRDALRGPARSAPAGDRRVVPRPRTELPPGGEPGVREFGRALFRALLPDEARRLYDRSREVAQQRGVGLRLRLRVLDPGLAVLPWELLYDPGQDDYLCRSPTTPVVRHVEAQHPIPETLRIPGPLRILGLVATPGDLPSLGVADERRWIDQAVRELPPGAPPVVLEWLAGQTWRALRAALAPGQGPWHIFHFVGHGAFNSAADAAGHGGGYVALTDETGGGTYRLPAADLGRLLRRQPALRLAVLNACEGARGGTEDLFAGTAATLIRMGLPAVVAMQYRISDAAAKEFARAFYDALARGLPVETSVAEARDAMALAAPGTLEWATPVLYLRAPDTVLFDMGT